MPRRAISPQQKADIKTLIVKTLKTGSSIKGAYGYAGIDKATYYRWLEKDSDFSDTVERSQAQVEVMCTHNIIKAGDKDWRASHAWLKANRSETWGDKTTIAGDKQSPLMVEAKIDHKLEPATIFTALDILRDAGMLEPPTEVEESTY